jgi:hypothetical protein
MMTTRSYEHVDLSERESAAQLATHPLVTKTVNIASAITQMTLFSTERSSAAGVVLAAGECLVFPGPSGCPAPPAIVAVR